MRAPDGCLCQSPCQLDNTRECPVFMLLQALEEHRAAEAPADAHATGAVAEPARVGGGGGAGGAGADPIEDSDEEGATAPPQAVAGALLPLAPP